VITFHGVWTTKTTAGRKLFPFVINGTLMTFYEICDSKICQGFHLLEGECVRTAVSLKMFTLKASARVIGTTSTRQINTNTLAEGLRSLDLINVVEFSAGHLPIFYKCTQYSKSPTVLPND